MRFHLGAIPESPDFNPVGEWTALREPPASKMSYVAFPIAILLAVLGFAGWALILRPAPRITLFPFSWWGNVLLVVGIVVVHELLHGVVQPGFPRSRRNILGFWPRKGLFFAHYDGEMSRNRCLLMFVLPFLVLSIGPAILVLVSGRGGEGAAAISLWNAVFCSMDLFGFTLVAAQVPSGATVRNQGWCTYWKRESLVSGAAPSAAVTGSKERS